MAIPEFRFPVNQMDVETAGANLLARRQANDTGQLENALTRRKLQAYDQQLSEQNSPEAKQRKQMQITREDRAAAIEDNLKKFEVIGQVMNGVRDQSSYDAARVDLANILGPEAAQNLPPTYNAQEIERNKMKAMSVKDTMANELAVLKANQPMFGAVPTAGGIGVFNKKTGDLSVATDDTGAPIQAPPKGKGGGNLPAAALKMQQEALDAIGISGSTNADLGAVLEQLKSGKLTLGLVKNAVGYGRNYMGQSDENSRNLQSFKSTLEKLRNDSLRLNKGVQTDGDAQRAWNELFDNINDQEYVKQKLGEIQRINERGALLQQANIDAIRENYGADPMDATGRLNQPAAVGTTARKKFNPATGRLE